MSVIRRIIEKEQTHSLHSLSISDGKRPNLQPVVTVAASFMRNKMQVIIPENVHSLTFCQSELYLIMELENFTK